MRIAFTSCFSAALFPHQPVWREIANARPDVLILLGDSIYLDCSGGLTPDGQQPLNVSGLQSLSANEFAEHAHRLYRRQLEQPEFKSLIAGGAVKTYAIWDDHDFLWDNAHGAEIMGSPLEELVYPSRALFSSWCDAIAGTNTFPAAPPPWTSSTREPGYRHVDLGVDVHLHLTDGRTWREDHGRALLGSAQLAAIEQQMKAAPAGATHLLASGSVIEQRSGESWAHCEAEYEALHRLAQTYNVLVLSGDVHDNNLAAYRIGERFLFEATASGAALKTLVTFGSLQRNYGLLDIDDENLHIQLFKSNIVPQYRATIDRKHWT